MAQDVITVKPRKTGKGAARACRREGLIPAIIYGKNIDPVPVALDSRAVKKLLGHRRGHIHHIVTEDSKFEGDVMVQDIDRDPITGKFLHIDLRKISLTDKVKTDVPITIIGETELEKRGLILQRQMGVITVECLPKDIPANVVLDVSKLSPGNTVTAGEIKLPDKVRLVTLPSEVVAVAVTPKAGAEVEEESEEARPEAEKPETSKV